MDSSYRTLQTRELEVLLRDVVEQRMGPDVTRVLDAIMRLQSCTLVALAAELPDVPENQLRLHVGSLMKHEAVGYDDASATYSASFGTGMLPAFFPLIARYLADAYHHAAELVALTLFEFHDLPFESLVRQVLRVQPDVDVAVQKAFNAMRDDEVIVSIGSTCAMVTTAEATQQAHQRHSGTKRSNDADGTASYQLNWPVLLHRMRCERMRRFVAHNISPVAERVLSAFLSLDANQPSPARTNRGFPRLHQSSSPQSAGTLQRRFPAIQPSALMGAIETFTCDAAESFLVPAASSSASSVDPAYSVSYASAARIMQRELYEGIVLSRHGIVGSRIVKLLAENEAMEDRFVAEEALITHADARTTLTAMLRDGFVKLLELPKGNIAERLPKNSVFLWTLNKDQLLETLQTQVVKALCNTRTALAQELASFRAAMPQTYFIDPATTILSLEESRLATKHEIQRVALQHATVALLERALVALYF